MKKIYFHQGTYIVFYFANLTFLYMKNTYLQILVSEFISLCPEMLRTLDSFHVQVLSDLLHCTFLCNRSLDASFSIDLLGEFFFRFSAFF